MNKRTSGLASGLRELGHKHRFDRDHEDDPRKTGELSALSLMLSTLCDLESYESVPGVGHNGYLRCARFVRSLGVASFAAQTRTQKP